MNTNPTGAPVTRAEETIMDANAPAKTDAAEGQSLAAEDVARLDATLHDEDWPVIQRLWRTGVTNEIIYRLLRLRLHYRGGRRSPYGAHLDGFQPDARAYFVRWLVRQGKLNEGL
jgi:hypothetical protein